MANELRGKRIAFLAADGFEQVELTSPRQAITDAGARPELISIKPGRIQGVNGMDKADTVPVDRTAAEANPDDYDALVMPGGVANPDKLRVDPSAVRFVRAFFDAGKPVGAICHGPWTLINAGVVRGRTLTSWPSLEADIRNAGGNWVDEQVHTEKGLVSSRKPDDLPAFNQKIVEEFKEGRHPEQARLAHQSEMASPVQ